MRCLSSRCWTAASEAEGRGLFFGTVRWQLRVFVRGCIAASGWRPEQPAAQADAAAVQPPLAAGMPSWIGASCKPAPTILARRVALGAKIDAELADRKGRIMLGLLDRYRTGGSATPPQDSTKHIPPAAQAGAGKGSPAPSSGCPFGHGSAPAAGPTAAALATTGVQEAGADSFEAARRQLYAWDAVPAAFRDMVSAEAAEQAQKLGLAPFAAESSSTSASGAESAGDHTRLSGLPLAFLDHAWGQVPPLAQVR